MKSFLVIMLSYLTLSASAFAVEGYVTDSSGKIVKTGSGLCLRSGTYTSANAVGECEPVAKAAVPVSLSGDVLFDFDSSALTERGRESLDKIAATIEPGSTVTVVGHTDIIGSTLYNFKLSQQRAVAVGDYLAAKSGFTSKFDVKGVGSSKPTDATKICEGIKDFEQYKACLAPDRRVVITIVKPVK